MMSVITTWWLSAGGACGWTWEIIVNRDSSRSWRPTTSSSLTNSFFTERKISFCPSRIIFSSRSSGWSNWPHHRPAQKYSMFTSDQSHSSRRRDWQPKRASQDGGQCRSSFSHNRNNIMGQCLRFLATNHRSTRHSKSSQVTNLISISRYYWQTIFWCPVYWRP